MKAQINDIIAARAQQLRESQGTLPAWRIARKEVLKQMVEEARTAPHGQGLLYAIVEILVDELL